MKYHYLNKSLSEFEKICAEFDDKSDEYDEGSYKCADFYVTYSISIPSDYATPISEFAEEMKEECADYEKDWIESKEDDSSEKKSNICMVTKIVNEDFLNEDFLKNDKYGTFVDERDCQLYRTIELGNDVWLAQNLNYEIGNSRCYKNDSELCLLYGALYDWNTAMNVCPSGWKLPSKNDLQNLKNSVENDLDLLSTQFSEGTNLSGFSAAPAGEYYKGFIDKGNSATYWSSDEADEVGMAYYWFYNFMKSVTESRIDSGGDMTGFKSVRCIKNK